MIRLPDFKTSDTFRLQVEPPVGLTPTVSVYKGGALVQALTMSGASPTFYAEATATETAAWPIGEYTGDVRHTDGGTFVSHTETFAFTVKRPGDL